MEGNPSMTSPLQRLTARTLGVAFALSLALGIGTLASASSSDDVGRSMLDYSFERATSEFYKPLRECRQKFSWLATREISKALKQ